MAKLVKAKIWVARYFEPGSEPDLKTLEEWVLTEHTGALINKALFIYDDALFPAHIQSKDAVSAMDLLRAS